MSAESAVDPFGGTPTEHIAPSVFANLEPGQTARGVYLGMESGGKYGDQPILFSVKAGACFVWPAHIMLTGALSPLPAWSPVEITRDADKGRTSMYRVKAWPVLAADSPLRATAAAASRECVATLAKVRTAGTPAPAAAVPPVDGAGPVDDGLPF